MADYSDEDEEPRYTIRYEGEDKDHPYCVRDGVAKATFENGDTFEGTYVGGKRQGKGVYVFKTGGRYEGDYVDNKREGAGTFTAPDGGCYTGQWLADKRHGQGEYRYANGDVYQGGWAEGLKHGPGRYVYAAGGAMQGVWVKGRCLNGVWEQPDGGAYYGKFRHNTPSGDGLLVHPNGLTSGGKFAEGKWITDAFAKPELGAAPPAPQPVDEMTALARALDKSVLKADHFDGIAKLAKEPESPDGAPNFRALVDYPVFGTGQPTFDGLQSVLEHLQEEKLDNVTWINLRPEPVVYAGENPFAPRDYKAPSVNLCLALKPEQFGQLEDRLVSRIREQVRERSGLLFSLQDSFAVDPAERQSRERIDEIKDLEEVRTLAQAFERLVEDGHRVELVRIPILNSHEAPPLAVWDELVRVLREHDSGSSVVFNCQMGTGRTTFGMIVAGLIRLALDPDANAEEEEESKEESREEEEDDDEEEDLEEEEDEELTEEEIEERRAKRREERRAEKERERERKAKEAAEAEEAAETFDVKQGEYTAVMRLVKAYGKKKGLRVKAQVDDMIERAKHFEHFRDAILEAKQRLEEEKDSARHLYWREQGAAYLQRYFYLIAFNMYLKETTASETPFEKPFSEWVKEHEAWFDFIGSPSSFDWN